MALLSTSVSILWTVAATQAAALDQAPAFEASAIRTSGFEISASIGTSFTQGPAAQNQAAQNQAAQTQAAGPVGPKRSADTPAPSFEIALPALLDDQYLGDISVRVTGDVISLDLPRFLELLKSDLTPEALKALTNKAQNGRLIVGDIDIQGLTVSYNPQLQQIEIKPVNDARNVRVLRLASQQSPIQTITETPSNFSLFLTPTVRLENVWEDTISQNTGFQDIRGTLDFGGRIGGEKGIAFLSRQRFQTGQSANFVRDETSLYYDDLSRVLRATAGDLRPRGASFQSTPAMAGVSLERFFEMEPSRLIRPVAQTGFELDRPSTIEIRLNGVTHREIFLQPGRYDLQDLPLVQGSNAIELVIRDDRGREEIISNTNFFDFDLLQKGLTDFSIAAGVKTDRGSRGVIYRNKPVLTAFARRGMTSDLTAGIDIQGDSDGANGGVSGLWASPVGIWRFEGSASARRNFGTGFAGSLGYRATGRLSEKWNWSANLDAKYLGDNFATIAADPDSGGSNQSIAALINGGFQLTQPGWSFNFNTSYSVGRYNNPDTLNAVLGTTYAISRNLTGSLYGRYTDDGFGADQGLSIQLTWRPGRNQDVRSRYDTLRQEAEVRYRKSASQNVGSLSYSAGAIHNAIDKSIDISGDAFYVGNRFEASVNHGYISSNLSSKESKQVSGATLSNSLVFANGSFAVGRPVQNSFAILSPHKTLKDNKIYVDPTGDGFSAKSDFLGAAVATDISPFSNRLLYVDVEDLPVGYDLGKGAYSMRPPQYSGYKVTVGSGESFTMVGWVTAAETGAPVAYIGGGLDSLDNPDAETIPAFTNRNGRLAATGIKPGRYRLTLFTEPNFTQDVTISEDGPNLLDIGQIKVNLK